MAIRKVVRDGLRKAVLWALETDPSRSLPPHTPRTRMKPKTRTIPGSPNLKTPDTTRLVLETLLHLHDEIQDGGAWDGYEGTPEQIETLMWEVYGILAKNPWCKTPEAALEIWIEDYARMHLEQG